jgi:Flp pilus assembly pilin Flp
VARQHAKGSKIKKKRHVRGGMNPAPFICQPVWTRQKTISLLRRFVMEILKRLVMEEDGQGITEYALIVGFVVFGIWLAITSTNIGGKVSNLFTQVGSKVDQCASGSGACSSS